MTQQEAAFDAASVHFGPTIRRTDIHVIDVIDGTRGAVDVIVGAPFEDGGSGAAYVYHGCATGLVDHYAQKLTPALLRLPALRGFAHSFASLMDIDNNRYPGRTLVVPIRFLPGEYLSTVEESAGE